MNKEAKKIPLGMTYKSFIFSNNKSIVPIIFEERRR